MSEANNGAKKSSWTKRILIGVGALVGIFVIGGFFLPQECVFERSTVINAPTSEIHPYVGDLTQWDKWSPWQEEDPTIKVTAGSQTTGVGATQSWTGESGNGRLEFTKASPTEGVAYDMVFDESYESTGAVSYTPVGEGTKVTWTMRADHGMNIMERYMGLLMGGAVEKMFDRGLEKLKATVESK